MHRYRYRRILSVVASSLHPPHISPLLLFVLSPLSLSLSLSFSIFFLVFVLVIAHALALVPSLVLAHVPVHVCMYMRVNTHAHVVTKTIAKVLHLAQFTCENLFFETARQKSKKKFWVLQNGILQNYFRILFAFFD